MKQPISISLIKNSLLSIKFLLSIPCINQHNFLIFLQNYINIMHSLSLINIVKIILALTANVNKKSNGLSKLIFREKILYFLNIYLKSINELVS